MMPTVETKVTRNIEEEAMEAKARVEETVEATIAEQAEMTIAAIGWFIVFKQNIRLLLMFLNTNKFH